MLLQALHQYSVGKKLLDALPFQMREVHWLTPINPLGEVRGSGFSPLSSIEKKGEKEKEVPGRELLLPRFPGENNGGKAYYLAESFLNIFGLRKDAGEALPTVAKSPSDRNAVRAHQHFWERIQQAHARTNDPRLKALLAFRIRYLSPTPDELRIFEWLRWQPNEASRDKKPEWHGHTDSSIWKPLTKINVVAFMVGLEPFYVPSKGWADDPCWADWATAYRREAFAEVVEEVSQSSKSICLVSGEIGLPVARSHKPKIRGVPGLDKGGYLVSFATESPAFSSFGFEMGVNAPIAEEVAASYALGLNELLADSKTHCTIGDVAFCYWTCTFAEVIE